MFFITLNYCPPPLFFSFGRIFETLCLFPPHQRLNSQLIPNYGTGSFKHLLKQGTHPWNRPKKREGMEKEFPSGYRRGSNITRGGQNRILPRTSHNYRRNYQWGTQHPLASISSAQLTLPFSQCNCQRTLQPFGVSRLGTLFRFDVVELK